MAFTKKKWVNVPDPSNPPSIPEGQDALARFDADNMNRIEEGIEDSANHTIDAAKHITPTERTAWNNKANSNHTHNYAGSLSAGGEAYSAWRLPFMTISSSDTSHKGYWRKFATLKSTGNPWEFLGVKLAFQDGEVGTLSGILNVYARVKDNVASESVELTWDTINNLTYTDCVAIVKESDGVFSLYFRAPYNYCTMNITLLVATHSKISFVNSNEWIKEITPLKSSKYTPLYSYSQTDLVAGVSELETGKLYFVYE